MCQLELHRSLHLGGSAWLYNGSSTQNIGLTDTEHTSNEGIKFSQPHQLNEAGQAIGQADRYNGGANFLGRSAWLHDGSSTQNIGLTDTEHSRNDGYKSSYVNQLNEAGQVLGYSNRYNGNASELGQSSWLYDGSSTQNIGQIDTEHTKNNGYKFSQARWLNEAGQVLGYSNRYNGSASELGQSSWLYDGSSTQNIGLTDTEHTRNNGYQFSDPRQLNESGQAIGYSYRYSGGRLRGQSAWLYDGSSTKNIGLIQASL